MLEVDRLFVVSCVVGSVHGYTACTVNSSTGGRHRYGCSDKGISTASSEPTMGPVEDEIDLSARYLFYLHGKIIEDRDCRQ